RPRRRGRRADHDDVVADVHVVVAGTVRAFLILPGRQRGLLARRDRLVRNFPAGIDARHRVLGPDVGDAVSRPRRDRVGLPPSATAAPSGRSAWTADSLAAPADTATSTSATAKYRFMCNLPQRAVPSTGLSARCIRRMSFSFSQNVSIRSESASRFTGTFAV